jgi:hypothetical protein
MRIKFKIEGGFVGFAREFEDDSNNLPSVLLPIFENLISNKSEYLNLEAHPHANDVLKYTIVIKNMNVSKIFVFDDLNLPEELVPLINYFSENSKFAL